MGALISVCLSGLAQGIGSVPESAIPQVQACFLAASFSLGCTTSPPRIPTSAVPAGAGAAPLLLPGAVPVITLGWPGMFAFLSSAALLYCCFILLEQVVK